MTRSSPGRRFGAIALVVSSLLACNDSQVTPTSLLSPVPSGSAQTRVQAAQPSLRKMPNWLAAAPNIGFLRVPGQAPLYFRTDRVVLRPRPGEDLVTALKLLGDGKDLTAATADGTGLLRPAPNKADPWTPPKGDQPAPRTPSWRLVNLPTQILTQQQEALQGALIERRLGASIEFGSDAARRAAGFVLQHNAAFRERPVVLDVQLSPQQLMTTSVEGAKLHAEYRDYPLGPTSNFPTMDMRRAWRLAQGASAAPGSPIRVAVIDAGFEKQPIGLVWAGVIEKGSQEPGLAFGDPSTKGPPWHGSAAGSALGATVNDEVGAAGAALIGAGNQTKPAKFASDLQRIQMIAVSVPDFNASTFAAYLLRAIDKDADGGGADIVTMSWGFDCDQACRTLTRIGDWSPLIEAVAKVTERATFFSSAGNVDVDLDAQPQAFSNCATAPGPGCVDCGTKICPLDLHWQLPCELENVHCVGGVNPLGTRWVTGTTGHASNYGRAVSVWGPAQYVAVNPPSVEIGYEWAFGTSLATPFVAGMLALAESTWKTRPTLATIHDRLSKSTRDVSDEAPLIAAGVLSGYQLMRQELKLAGDARESNDTPNAAKSQGQIQATEVLTLDRAQDHDYLPIDVTDCSRLVAKLDYVPDAKLGELTATLTSGSNAETSTVTRRTVDDSLKEDGLLTLEASVCPGRHYLDVHQVGALTTVYSVATTLEPMVCPVECAPPIPIPTAASSALPDDTASNPPPMDQHSAK